MLIEAGQTKVICTASVEDRVPMFLRGTGKGWVTSEYGMLPRATSTRSTREATRGKVDGRTQEIQRLIGRSLRAVIQLDDLGERTLWVDCDVIQADGGTRTASITGGFVALVLALEKLREAGTISKVPVDDYVAAISVGIVGGMPVLDLAYEEDAAADVDMNIVKTGNGRFIEVQGTAERTPFGHEALTELLRLADAGITRTRRTPAGDRRQLSESPLVARASPRRDDQPEQARRDPDHPRGTADQDRRLGSAPASRGTGGSRPHVRGEREAQGDVLQRPYGQTGGGRGFRTRDRRTRRRTGVRSARFNGSSYPEKFAAIYHQLRERGVPGRTARFICALAVAAGERIVFEATGTVEGEITRRPRGKHGFGYDPIFFYPPYGRTLAELAPEDKAAVSHRGKAFRALRTFLETFPHNRAP